MEKLHDRLDMVLSKNIKVHKISYDSIYVHANMYMYVCVYVFCFHVFVLFCFKTKHKIH